MTMDSLRFSRLPPRPAHACAFAEKASIRPCPLYPSIEPRKKDSSWAASSFTNVPAPSCGGFYPKRKGFQLLQDSLCHVSHILQDHNDEHDVVVVADDDNDVSTEPHLLEVHMDSFHVLHNDHDRIDVVNRDGNDVSVETHCHGSHMNSFHNENVNKEKLPHGLHTDFLPRHVAIIMDGNSRWATQKGLQRSAGHEAGVETLKLIVELSAKWGVQALTVFGFSTENWNRPKVEVSFLMQLFLKALREELPILMRENILIRFIGNLKQLPWPLQSFIHEVERKTSENSGLKLTIAFNYSGRYDILQACQKVAKKVEKGKLRPEDIVESDIQQELGTSWMKEIENPDLLIRTSGELRLSNFLLWQLAYTELYFMTEYWPEVNETCYADALLSYQKRDRRFGARSLVNPDQ